MANSENDQMSTLLGAIAYLTDLHTTLTIITHSSEDDPLNVTTYVYYDHMIYSYHALNTRNHKDAGKFISRGLGDSYLKLWKDETRLKAWLNQSYSLVVSVPDNY